MRARLHETCRPLDAWDPVAGLEEALRRSSVVVFWAAPNRGTAAVAEDPLLPVTLEGPDPLEAARRRLAAVDTQATLQGTPLAFLATRFDPAREAAWPWEGLPANLLVLPGRMTWQRGGEIFAVSRRLEGDVPSGEGVRRVRRDDLAEWLDEPSAETWADWEAAVERALEAIHSGRLEKVALARRIGLQLEPPAGVARVVARLLRAYPDCRVFAFVMRRAAFVGASPEILLQRRRGRIRSLCLAGSAARSGEPAADAERARALFEDPKERREHEIVVHWIRERLAPLASDLAWDSVPGILRLRTVQHLATEITGSAPRGVDLLTLVRAIHPTPAVAGRPLDAALSLIRETERADRGWYAGALGWVGAGGDGEMVLGIRSALLRGETAHLYAGAGIVAGSEPSREWDEVAAKLRPMRMALGEVPSAVS
jgi:isochorismate synthase